MYTELIEFNQRKSFVSLRKVEATRRIHLCRVNRYFYGTNVFPDYVIQISTNIWQVFYPSSLYTVVSFPVPLFIIICFSRYIIYSVFRSVIQCKQNDRKKVFQYNTKLSGSIPIISFTVLIHFVSNKPWFPCVIGANLTPILEGFVN